ncbi:MAG: BatD family protein [Verrucomicrobiota bacterium]|nr:BatD family protein [Verrucomicrobiota bacterium]
MHRFKFTLVFFPWLLALSTSAEISVTAIFNPPRVARGDKAQYILEIKETSTSQQPEIEQVTSLPIPQSDDLELTNGRTATSQQTSIINGAREYSVTQQLIIDADAPRIGAYTLPSYVFQYKGQTLRAPAATLQVVERAADAGPTADELIFLKADAPDQLYIGQTATLELKLYVAPNVRLSSLSSFDRNADGFTISELPDSRETSEIVNGRSYRVLNWTLTITPIQIGPQDLNFQFTVSASLPGQNSRTRDPLGGRGFGSSLFDDFFTRSERFSLSTEPTTIEVLALPTGDKPASFTGAIGDFAMQVYTDRNQTRVGEPIMLSVEISGNGNFDRINGPIIPETAYWRSYEPESNFQPRIAGSALLGTKRFDYVMIPKQAGTLEIPEIRFAFFEPEAQRYTQLSSPAIEIEVSPSDRPASPLGPSTQTAPPPNTVVSPLQQELTEEQALLTLDYRPRYMDATSHWNSPRLWLFNAAIAVGLITYSLALRRRHRLREDPAYAARQKAKHELRASKTAAKQANLADHFYAQAQSAIRLAVTYRSGENHRTADINAVCEVMLKKGLSDQVISQTRRLFATADALRFAGKESKNDLAKAKSELEGILKAI